MNQNASKKFKQVLSQRNKTKNPKWDQLSDLEEQNMQQMKSEEQKPTQTKQNIKTKQNRQVKKAVELQEYEIALSRLRSENKKFHKPFDRQRLNISTMQAIKMIKDALQKDKDFTRVLRNMGCKTRMRVRNKTAAKELFQAFLQYLQTGKIQSWLTDCHKKLMQSEESNFEMRIDD